MQFARARLRLDDSSVGAGGRKQGVKRFPSLPIASSTAAYTFLNALIHSLALPPTIDSRLFSFSIHSLHIRAAGLSLL